VKIDCCQGGCMLHYQDDSELTECKFCDFQDICLPRVKTKDIKRCQLKECFICQSFQDYRDCMLQWIQQGK